MEGVTNNYVELMALDLSTMLAAEKRIQNIPIFGYSVVILNWMKGTSILENYLLKPIFEENKPSCVIFLKTFCFHTFRK